MNEGKIAVRYSKALFLLAQEDNVLEQVSADMDAIQHTIEESIEFKDFLFSPILAASFKKELAKKSLENGLSKITMQFLFLLFENKREFFLPSIFRVFKHMLKESQGIKTGILTTAIKLDKQTENDIVTRISKKMHATLELASKTDKNILGGFVLRIEDQQIDASVASKLTDIKKELLNN